MKQIFLKKEEREELARKRDLIETLNYLMTLVNQEAGFRLRQIMAKNAVGNCGLERIDYEKGVLEVSPKIKKPTKEEVKKVVAKK